MEETFCLIAVMGGERACGDEPDMEYAKRSRSGYQFSPRRICSQRLSNVTRWCGNSSLSMRQNVFSICIAVYVSRDWTLLKC